MNICIVYTRKIDFSLGGVESVCINLAMELMKRDDINIFHIYIHNDSGEDKPGIGYLNLREEISADNWEESQLLVAEFLKRNQMDFIWNHDQHGLLQKLVYETGKQLNIRTVSVYHNNPYLIFADFRDRYAYSLFRWREYGEFRPFLLQTLKYPLVLLNKFRVARNFLRGLFLHSHSLVLLSDKFRKEFIKLSGLSVGNRLHAISNPICPVEYQFCPEKKKNQILVVSRHVWFQKRIDRIIRIWEKVMNRFPDWELIILGDGPHHRDFVHLAERLQTQRLTFAGVQNPAEFYRNAKILCLTSSWEGFGLVLTEAQQYGCVPIAYRSYSSLDDIIVDGENGYSVVPFREEEYIDKLTRLMTDDAQREKMAVAAMDSVKKFHVEKIAEQWVALFSSLQETRED